MCTGPLDFPRTKATGSWQGDGALWGPRGHSADCSPRSLGWTPGSPYWTKNDHSGPPAPHALRFSP